MSSCNAPNLAFRRRVLETLGATDSVVAELLSYNESHFVSPAIPPAFPLPSEPFVETWRSFAEQSKAGGGIPAVSDALVQLLFPVREGMSRHPDYLRATQLGELPGKSETASGLHLVCPERCMISIHSTAAGEIPVITAGERADFEALVQAFARRNEPVPVPASMGATMVAGYNNWHRIRDLRQRFNSNPGAGQGWAQEFQRLRGQTHLYQDRFVLASCGPYSGVPAQDVGLEESDWLGVSLRIRLEHEFTHYFTGRVLASARNSLFDELIADYAGITAAVGSLPRGWLGRFYGVDPDGEFYGGRMANYRGKPALSNEAFRCLAKVVARAAANLEHFDQQCFGAKSREPRSPRAVLALTEVTLEELASSNGADLLRARYAQAEYARPGSAGPMQAERIPQISD
jgi:hypothetical protein